MNKLYLLLCALPLVAACDAGFERESSAAEQAEAPRGPNGGRLLTDGDFTLELAIFEAGVPPEYHAWASSAGRPVLRTTAG